VEIFWQSAICKTCLALFVFFLVAPMVKTAVMKRRAARKQSGGNA
jgi:TctA family transporter